MPHGGPGKRALDHNGVVVHGLAAAQFRVAVGTTASVFWFIVVPGHYRPHPVPAKWVHESASENRNAGIPMPPVLIWNTQGALRPIEERT